MRRLAVLVISGFIVGVLALQTITALSISGGPLRPSPYLWPFLDYPMYGMSHYPGDAIDRWTVIVTLEDGEEVAMGASGFNLNYWIYRREIVDGLRYDDAERVRPIIEVYARETGRRPVAMRLENHPYVLTRDGIEQPGKPVVVGSIRFDETEEDG